MIVTLFLAGAVAGSMGQSLPEKPVEKMDLAVAGGGLAQFPVPHARLTVVVFLELSCPIGNRMGPELGRVSHLYSSKGVSFVFDYVGSVVSAREALANARKFKLEGIVVQEPRRLADAIGATITPEAAIVDPSGTVLYRGRVNDLYLDHARVRPKPLRNDLRIALDEALAGKPISRPVTVAVGCFIPR